MTLKSFLRDMLKRINTEMDCKCCGKALSLYDSRKGDGLCERCRNEKNKMLKRICNKD